MPNLSKKRLKELREKNPDIVTPDQELKLEVTTFKELLEGGIEYESLTAWHTKCRNQLYGKRV